MGENDTPSAAPPATLPQPAQAAPDSFWHRVGWWFVWFSGFQTAAQRHHWADQLARLGFAGIVAGIGVLSYHELSRPMGVAAIVCGIIASWIGALLARSGGNRKEDSK